MRYLCCLFYFFFSSRRRHTRCLSDWSSDVCSSDLCCNAFPVREALVRALARRQRSAALGYKGLDGRHAQFHRLAYGMVDRKSTRLNSSHLGISYAVFCLKKKKTSSNFSGELV